MGLDRKHAVLQGTVAGTSSLMERRNKGRAAAPRRGLVHLRSARHIVVRDAVEPLMAVTGCATEVNPGAAVYLADESAAYRTVLAAGKAGSRHAELNANVVFGAFERPASCP